MVNHRAQNALGTGCPAPCGLIARGGRLRKVCDLRCASIISQSLARSHQPSPAPCQNRKERGTRPQVSPCLRDLGAAATPHPSEPYKPRTNPNLNARTESTKSMQAPGYEWSGRKIREGLSVTSELRFGPPRSRKTSETWGTRPAPHPEESFRGLGWASPRHAIHPTMFFPGLAAPSTGPIHRVFTTAIP